MLDCRTVDMNRPLNQDRERVTASSTDDDDLLDIVMEGRDEQDMNSESFGVSLDSNQLHCE